MGKKSVQKTVKKIAANRQPKVVESGNGIKVVDYGGQKVQAFEKLAYASQAATKLVQMLQTFAKTVPLGDGVGLFADIQDGARLINNTLALEAEAEVKREKAAAETPPLGDKSLLKD